MCTEIYNALSTRDIIVTQEFVNYADAEFAKGYSSRKNCDYLLLEHHLLKNRLVNKPKSWRHDFIIGDNYIDVKWIKSRFLNTNQKKVDQFKDSVMMGELTHFLFYALPEDYGYDSEIYKPGQIVQHTFLDFVNARTVLSNLNESNTSGFYYRVR
jgi:hypothetical protein